MGVEATRSPDQQAETTATALVKQVISRHGSTRVEL